MGINMSLKIKITGKYAIFNRPEIRKDKCSYDMITPYAAKGILESVYGHPGMVWVIDRIHVLNPIKTGLYTKETAYQMVVLKDVSYVMEVHFSTTDKAGPEDNPAKFQTMAAKRIERQEYYHDIFLGDKRFPAELELLNGNIKTAYSGTQNLGYMIYDYDFTDPEHKRPVFFRAKLKDGILDLTKKPKILLQ